MVSRRLMVLFILRRFCFLLKVWASIFWWNPADVLKVYQLPHWQSSHGFGYQTVLERPSSWVSAIVKLLSSFPSASQEIEIVTNFSGSKLWAHLQITAVIYHLWFTLVAMFALLLFLSLSQPSSQRWVLSRRSNRMDSPLRHTFCALSASWLVLLFLIGLVCVAHSLLVLVLLLQSDTFFLQRKKRLRSATLVYSLQRSSSHQLPSCFHG